MVVFGGSGDLTSRKLVPALYNLSAHGLLPDAFAVIGIGRSEFTDEAFRERLAGSLHAHAAGAFDARRWAALAPRLRYLSGNFRDAGTYRRLAAALHAAEEQHGTGGNVLFYLSTPPSFFAEIVQQLQRAGLTTEESGRWRRVVVEKPFGHDLESARALNRELLAELAEHQIYRIDHYLGKETVQNILVFRFANGIFEPIWNRRYVDHVQITVVEQLGVGHRGAYYEEAGALRDMVPNHLSQLLALTAMEPPVSFEADAVRDEKAKVMQAIQPHEPGEVLQCAVRGQYAAGEQDGRPLPAYRDEPRVAPDSRTETFAALELQIDNWRWAGVPFYLRTGKRLAARVSEIAIQFKRAPFILFRETPVGHLTPNQLVIRLRPREGIQLSFGAKVPGPALALGNVNMDFCYADYFGAQPSTGYETLLYDCMKGDATLFERADNVEAAWQVVAPILDVWGALAPRDFPNYVPGSVGPAGAAALIERGGRRWREIG